MTLTVYDIRDLDLMMKLAEQGSGATSKELASELGMDDNGQHVGTRLAWMRRFGMLDFNEKLRVWSLSPGGGRVVESKLRAATRERIEAIPDEQIIEVMAHVTTRYRHGDDMTAAMLRREFQFGTKRR